MPYLKCCIPNCKTKIPPGSNLVTIGSPQFYQQFVIFVENAENYDKSSIVCSKHHAQVCTILLK